MRPLHLNLASRPYRDYRPVYAVVIVSALLIAFMMLNNVDTYYKYIHDTKTTRAEIERVDAETQHEQRQTDTLSQRLKTINIRQLADQTQFVNTQLAERAFSWSELLDRLERVIPRDVRIESISPSFEKTGIVRLTMQARAKTGSGMIDTLDSLNHEPQFSHAFPSAEQKNADGSYQFGIAVEYRPTIARVVQ
jgi:Tfp pilus assembly protein PilN